MPRMTKSPEAQLRSAIARVGIAGVGPIDRPGALLLASPLPLRLAGAIAVDERAGPDEPLAHDLVGVARRLLRRVHAPRRSRLRGRAEQAADEKDGDWT